MQTYNGTDLDKALLKIKATDLEKLESVLINNFGPQSMGWGYKLVDIEVLDKQYKVVGQVWYAVRKEGVQEVTKIEDLSVVPYNVGYIFTKDTTNVDQDIMKLWLK